MVDYFKGGDFKKEKDSTQKDKKGSKQELISYLKNEGG